MAPTPGPGTVPLPGFPRHASVSAKARHPQWDPLSLALVVAAGSLVVLLGWGVEQWRLSDREVPVHTAGLYAFP